MLRVSGEHNLIYVLEILSHCLGIIGRMNGSRNNLENRSGWQVGAKRPGSMELWHLRKLGWMDLCVELEKVETQQEVVALKEPENSSRLAVLVPTLLCMSPLGTQLKCRFDSPGVWGGGWGEGGCTSNWLPGDADVADPRTNFGQQRTRGHFPAT